MRRGQLSEYTGQWARIFTFEVSGIPDAYKIGSIEIEVPGDGDNVKAVRAAKHRVAALMEALSTALKPLLMDAEEYARVRERLSTRP